MKKKRLMITLLLVISILMFVGFAYAYLAAGVNNDDAQEASITTGTMNLTFADGTSAFQAKEINIGESVTKTFTIENTGTLDATASMYFKDLVNTYLEGSMTYRLEYSENENGPYKLLKAESDVPYSDNFTSQYLKLISNIIKVPAGEKLYYKLIITFNNLQDLDQSADLDAVLNTKFTLLASSNYEYCGESGNEFEYDECFDTIEECERNTFGGCYTQVRERSEYCYIEDDELYCYDSYEDCEYDVSTTDYPDNLCFEKDAEMVSCFNFDSTWTCYSGFQDWCEYDADAYTDFTGPYPNCTSVNFRNQGEILSTEYCFEGECYETLEECRADNYPYVEPGYDCYRVTTHDHDYVVLSESEKTLAALNLTNQVKDELTTYNMFNYTWAGYNPDGKALGIGETQGIYAMEDDFGMSYYFRGPKTLNNIVKFGKYDSDMYYYPISNVEYSTGSLADCQAEASYKEKYCTDEYKFASAGDDMYWRIVRINGDGTLRLMYIGTSPNATGINATAGISSFNRWGSNKKYAGYTYDNSAPDAGNGTSSYIKQYLDRWYSRSMNAEDSNIALAQFYSDTTGYHSEANTYWVHVYSSSDRLDKYYTGLTEEVSPTLKTETTNQTYGGRYNLKVGLINVDELVLSGFDGIYGAINYDETGALYPYTMPFVDPEINAPLFYSFSPAGYNSGSDWNDVFGISRDGELSFVEELDQVGYINPVINLTKEYARTLVWDSANGYYVAP